MCLGHTACASAPGGLPSRQGGGGTSSQPGPASHVATSDNQAVSHTLCNSIQHGSDPSGIRMSARCRTPQLQPALRRCAKPISKEKAPNHIFALISIRRRLPLIGSRDSLCTNRTSQHSLASAASQSQVRWPSTRPTACAGYDTARLSSTTPCLVWCACKPAHASLYCCVRARGNISHKHTVCCQCS